MIGPGVPIDEILLSLEQIVERLDQTGGHLEACAHISMGIEMIRISASASRDNNADNRATAAV